MSGPTGARCATHRDAVAVEVCTRCGAFLCGDCVEYVNGSTPACERCARTLTAAPTPTARVALALCTVGPVGMVAGLLLRGRPGLWVWAGAIPLGLIGLALAVAELRGRDSRPPASTRVAALARLGGAVHAAMVLVLAAAFVFFLQSARD